MKILIIAALVIFSSTAYGQQSAGVATLTGQQVEKAAVQSDSGSVDGSTDPKEEADRGGVDDETEILTSETGAANADTASQTQNGYTRPEPKQRLKNYVNSMFGPISLAQRAAQSGVGTWRNSPEEWGSGWEGFGRRFASGTGKSVIKNSAMYGLDEVLKVDSRFYRSEKRDVGSRIKNALISPVTARRPDGSRTIGIPRLVGTYTANVVAAETWYPARYDWKDGVRSGTISLGFNAAFNLIKEFVWKK